ncbi:ATP-dependent helicase HrpB [Halioxenophilus sp. WMMB6]|uniref:ATP-dependent helicase HrpB n=1 Tax=Halioxenophilus sp. WMMB6 TaxID=3073815 RepID=UPI00295E4136|nr:ATP-dependent helicase HrpB [Halioxenophilus sp. WMMB6]
MPELPHFPISDLLAEIQGQLQHSDQLALLAPPGAGKTTLVPLALLAETWLGQQKIILLQPRRIAARAAAERMAELLGEPVGARVGYRVRLETVVSDDTRIEVVTEGVFLRLLQADPTLAEVGLVIFDEFHERSLNSDLALALALSSRELFGDLREQALKLLVMSATLDGGGVTGLLSEACGEPVRCLESEGRAYPVETIYTGLYEPGRDQTPAIVAAIRRALAEAAGNLLVFLPGVGEIARTETALTEAGLADNVRVAAIHGSLNLADQRRVLQPPPANSRQITLATSIAQTSLTIPGISVVIDSGLIRNPSYDPRTGLTRLATQRISKATAAQRAGRAGRLAAGVCYRLWSASQQQQLAEQDTPEIVNADLTELVLQMRAWGVTAAEELHWLNPPSASLFASAEALLEELGALAGEGLSAHGQQLLQLPVAARIGHMLVRAKAQGLLSEATLLAALLAAKDPLQGAHHSVDIHERMDFIQHSQTPAAKRLRQEANQLARLTEALTIDTDRLPLAAEQQQAWLLANAYPDRLARRQRGADYKLANGRGVSLEAHDPLTKSEWLAVASLGGREGTARDRVFLAAAFDPSLLVGHFKHLVSSEIICDWDDANGRFVGEQRWRVGQLLWRSEAIAQLNPQQKRAAVSQRLRKRGLGLLNWTPEATQLRARLQWLATLQPEEPWPAVSDTALLHDLEQWFAPALDTITKDEDFQRVDVASLLLNLLDWPAQQRLNELLPSKIAVPSGSNIAIDYTQEPPVLAVRLQEMFGLATTPALAEGRLPLVIHLLSPAGRPLQITQDLGGFWAGSYQAVRKEMKGRYPKHHWPEDPYSVPATRRAKPRH